jgi:hypothetical protein
MRGEEIVRESRARDGGEVGPQGPIGERERERERETLKTGRPRKGPIWAEPMGSSLSLSLSLSLELLSSFLAVLLFLFFFGERRRPRPGW